MSNKINEKSPYSSFYQDKDNLSEIHFNDLKTNQDMSKPIIDSTKYSKSSFEDFDVKDEFIQKARNDLNLLPSEYRDKLVKFNNIFLLNSFIYPVYFIFYFTKDYPDLSEISRKRIVISTSLYLIYFLFYKKFSDRQYEMAYTSLRNKYTNNEIKNMINTYHEINSLNTDENPNV